MRATARSVQLLCWDDEPGADAVKAGHGGATAVDEAHQDVDLLRGETAHAEPRAASPPGQRAVQVLVGRLASPRPSGGDKGEQRRARASSARAVEQRHSLAHAVVVAEDPADLKVAALDRMRLGYPGQDHQDETGSSPKYRLMAALPLMEQPPLQQGPKARAVGRELKRAHSAINLSRKSRRWTTRYPSRTLSRT